MKKVEMIISEIEDIIDEGSSVPFSKKVLVDADEITELLSGIKGVLPEEIKQANWVTEEKDRILSEADQEAKKIVEDARKESDRIVRDAHSQVQRMVEDHVITQKAEEYGEELVTNAEKNARLLKSQSINYVDEMLAVTQEKLQEMLDVLEENRNELRED